MPTTARIALAFLVVGICLIAASFAWQQDLGFNRGYSEQDAQEYAAAGAELHDALHESAHSHGKKSKDDKPVDVAAAQARYDAAKARRDHAFATRELTVSLMKWSGIAITFVSTVTLWLKRD